MIDFTSNKFKFYYTKIKKEGELVEFISIINTHYLVSGTTGSFIVTKGDVEIYCFFSIFDIYYNDILVNNYLYSDLESLILSDNREIKLNNLLDK